MASPVATAGIKTALVLLLAFVAWRVLSLGMADHYAHAAPERALAWRPDHPEALFRVAEKLADAGADPARAEALARAALRSNPLDGRPWRVLGRLALARGDAGDAYRYHAQALRLSPRDLPSHGWMFEQELRAGRIAAALAHADLLLRLQPELMDRLFPILLELASERAATAAMAKMLASPSPWRARFVANLLQQPDGAVPLAALLGEAAGSEAGLTQNEWSAWLDRLSESGEAGIAYAYWASRQPSGLALANVHNGGFESSPDGTSFDWRFEHVPGASIELLSEPGVIGRQALSVGFDRQRVPFRHVRQHLLLSPGRYLLEGHQRADELLSARGLSWAVRCAGSGQVLGHSAGLRGTTRWSPFSLEFEVPGACGDQWLELVQDARSDSEQMVSGRAWFDELRVVRL